MNWDITITGSWSALKWPIGVVVVMIFTIILGIDLDMWL